MEEGKFVWQSSKKNLNFFDWSSGEPNDASYNNVDEDCIQLSTFNWKWNDVSCTITYLAAMCETIFSCHLNYNAVI